MMLKKIFAVAFVGLLIMVGVTPVQASVEGVQNEKEEVIMLDEVEVADGLIELRTPDNGDVIAYRIEERIVEDFENTEAFTFLVENGEIIIPQNYLVENLKQSSTRATSGSFDWTLSDAGRGVGSEQFTGKTGAVVAAHVTAHNPGNSYTVGVGTTSNVYYGFSSGSNTKSHYITLSSNLNGVALRFYISSGTLNTIRVSGSYTYNG